MGSRYETNWAQYTQWTLDMKQTRRYINYTLGSIQKLDTTLLKKAAKFFFFFIFLLVFYVIIYTVLQCDLPPLRPHWTGLRFEPGPGGPEAGTLPLDHHASLKLKIEMSIKIC